MPTVRLTLDKKSGDVKVEYEGFVGNLCYDTAERLKERLKSMGILISGETVQPTKHEQVLDGIPVRNGE